MNLGLVIVLLLMLHVVTKFNLGQDSEARFGQDFKFKFSRDTDVGLTFGLPLN